MHNVDGSQKKSVNVPKAFTRVDKCMLCLRSSISDFIFVGGLFQYGLGCYSDLFLFFFFYFWG